MSQKSRIIRFTALIFLCILAASILHAPAQACSYAALALQLWFEKMIPSLFPFMILSGLIIRLDYSRTISAPTAPFLGRLYHMNPAMCTSLLLGFLFGFPLGAKTIAEQYSLGQLTQKEAQFLLSFCNNIGPVYLLSFVLPLLDLSGQPFTPVIIILYFGIPLLYGLFLRYTIYRQDDFSWKSSYRRSNSNAISFHKKMTGFYLLSDKLSMTQHKKNTQSPSSYSFIAALDDSVISACNAITRLGGYMVFFMVCNILTSSLTQIPRISALISVLLEITSGLSLSRSLLPAPVLLTMLTFGGLSCFAQTYTCIRETDLSFPNYCLHKIIQTVIAFCLYTVFFSVFLRQRF